jgi:hypothetical protein
MTDEQHPLDPDRESGPGPGVELGYETRDASIPALVKFTVGLIVVVVVFQFALLGVYRLMERERPEAVATTAPENLYQQLRTLRSDEEKTLGGYGWVDRKAGVVRIPIDRAIELVAEKGDQFARGPKTELEMNSHGGTPVPADTEKDRAQEKAPPESKDQ